MDSRRRRRKRFDAAVVAADVAAVAVALPLTYWLRFYLLAIPFAPRGEWVVEHYFRIYPVALFAWMLSLAAVGIYHRSHEVLSMRVFQKMLKASLLAIVVVIAVIFFFRVVPEASLARSLAPLALVVVMAVLWTGRFLLRAWIRHVQETQGSGLRRLLIYGTGEIARDVAYRIRDAAHPLFRLAGFATPDTDQAGCTIDELPVFAVNDDLKSLMKEHDIDEVVLADPALSPEQTLTMMLDCEKEMVGCRTVPSLFQMRLAEMEADPIEGVPLYGLKETPLHGLNAVIKRTFDAIVAFVGLLIVLPFLPIIALAIKLDSKGPVLYKQKRVGLDGHRYSLYKFRSMRKEAEENSGPVWAKENDPRRTRVGTFLRSWNLDELPQLYNVLRGDMSLVGPRPERPFFVKQFKEREPRYMARHKVKSGLTGWAQVHGLRGDSSIAERLKYDLYYIENWSFWLDLKILFMTVRAWRRGAY